MDTRKLKGSVPNGYLNYVKRKWGVTGMEDAMKFADISTRPKDGDWFPMEKSERILEWIALNRGMEQVKEAGRYAAMDLGVFKHLFASLMGLNALLKRSVSNYKLIFNFGDMSFKRTDDGFMIVIKDGRVTDYSCPAWEGAIGGLIQLTRSRGTVESSEGRVEDCTFVIKL